MSSSAARQRPFRPGRFLGCLCVAAMAASWREPAAAGPDAAAIRRAIEDMIATYGNSFSEGPRLLSELRQLEHAPDSRPLGRAVMEARLKEFQRRALLANPALKNLEILCIRRAWTPRPKKGAGIHPGHLAGLGIPSNHECHSSLPPDGYDNEMAVFRAEAPARTWRTLWRPAGGEWIGDPALHWNGDRILFSMVASNQWALWEMRLDGAPPRPVSREPPDVNCFDPCYLPDDRVLCASDATAQCVPCWHGVPRKLVANLFVMEPDGSAMRRLTFDQDHDMDPAVLADGTVVYNRWDYTGINRLFLRLLMRMNPDGTGQRALYGSNSWFPNGLYSPHELPGRPGVLVCILAGYHGPGRTGHLVIVDTRRGRSEDRGIVQRISGTGAPLAVEYMDRYTENAWPKFHSCHPITDKQFLVSGWMSPDERAMGLYLADVYDNVVPLHVMPGHALLDPIPVRPRPRPPVLPAQSDPAQTNALVYVQDVHAGPGLAGVPRGVVRRLRVIAYNFGYPGLAGNDKIGISGPWDAMRVLGTTPVEADGSAFFTIPANTPVGFQALDEQGAAVQLMRSWTSARPGERLSCVGCHEEHQLAASVHAAMSAALARPARPLEPWRGPARGFDFAREVQPVLDRHCVACHDGRPDRPDLRPEDKVAHYRGLVPGRLDLERMWPEHRAIHEGRVAYTPAYEALVPLIRRVNIGDDVGLLPPAFYHAGTSPLVQMLRKGHHGVALDDEAWDRLVTWIDLNGPCHGTWRDVFPVPIPSGADLRRRELHRRHGGPPDDPEFVPDTPVNLGPPTYPVSVEPSPRPIVAGWPFDAAAQLSAAGGLRRRRIEIGAGLAIEMVRIPAGRFVMGDAGGERDEWPETEVDVRDPFWIGVSEISNEQFRRAFPEHTSGFYVKRHAERGDDRGLDLNEPGQPALRVSWREAMDFCRWVAAETGLPVSLPTEAQWEYACRAGRNTPFHFGGLRDDFGPYANLADYTFATYGYIGRSPMGWFQVDGDIDFIVAEGVWGAELRFNDGACVTEPAGTRKSNPFGLVDMHGNAAEWTLSLYRPYPYDSTDGRENLFDPGPRVVRGGSFLDGPARARASFRLGYPPWQKVHDVGFRVVVNETGREPSRRTAKAP